MARLLELRSLVRQERDVPLSVGSPTGHTAGNEMGATSIFTRALDALAGADGVPAGGVSMRSADPLAPRRRDRVRELIDALTAGSVKLNRAVGAMVGLAIGDAAGAPLEFIAVDASLPPFVAAVDGHGNGRVAWLATELDAHGALAYVGERNKFRLLRGQWTDDTAMALCLADSLLVHGIYHGGDCRVRYFNWWHFGHNNAFRFDTRAVRRSVGLGANIATSLDELFDYEGAPADAVPPKFAGAGDDAGNGSMMRLAPVALRHHADEATAMRVAADQSEATHTGREAGACCEFMAFMLCAAMNRTDDDTTMIDVFLDQTVTRFIATVATDAARLRNPEWQRLLGVLRAEPASSAEAHWAWRQRTLPLQTALAARGTTYQGRAVSAGYFGAYSLDALAMVLWSLHGAASFSDAMVRVVNLLGDADSTGAICGQIAGAFYGRRGIVATPVGRRMLANVECWDRHSEIPLRAVMLMADGLEDCVLQQAGPAQAQD